MCTCSAGTGRALRRATTIWHRGGSCGETESGSAARARCRRPRAALVSEALTPQRGGGCRGGAHAGSCPSSVSPWNAPRATCRAVLGLPLAEVVIYRKSFPNILHLESPNRGYERKDRPQATPVQHCPRELSAPPRAWLRARVWRRCSEGGRGWGCRGPLRNDPGRAAQFSWLHGATSHLKATPSAAHPPTRRCVGHIPGEMSAERHRV